MYFPFLQVFLMIIPNYFAFLLCFIKINSIFAAMN